MEDRVLTMLSESTGNILDNEELISKLETAKKTSAVVKTRIEEGKQKRESRSNVVCNY